MCEALPPTLKKRQRLNVGSSKPIVMYACTGCHRTCVVLGIFLRSSFFASSHFCGACAMTARLEDELRLQLATTVSNISGLHPMFDDHWLTWVHNWSGSVTATNAGTRDPTAYSSAFLFDYLQHIISVDVIIRATEVSTPSFCYCFRCRRGTLLVSFW